MTTTDDLELIVVMPEVVPPRAGVDAFGRCLICGKPVPTSAGCPCQWETEEGPDA